MVAIIVRAFKKQVKTGTLIVIIDALIVVASTIYFKQIEVGLYSALAIYVLGKILDVFFEGINFTKMLLIISPKWEEISDRINKELRKRRDIFTWKGNVQKAR